MDVIEGVFPESNSVDTWGEVAWWETQSLDDTHQETCGHVGDTAGYSQRHLGEEYLPEGEGKTSRIQALTNNVTPLAAGIWRRLENLLT